MMVTRAVCRAIVNIYEKAQRLEVGRLGWNEQRRK